MKKHRGSDSTSSHRRALVLGALASPARQEIVSALAERPATVRDLSERLGRSRQALYFHLAALEAAGLARVQALRGKGRERQRVYELVRKRMVVAARRRSPRERAAAARAVSAMLRLTARELAAAFRDPGCCAAGQRRELVAIRGKTRLAPAELERLHRLLRKIVLLLRGGRRRNVRERLYALTIVLTPSRARRS